jgi:hypothetical protein
VTMHWWGLVVVFSPGTRNSRWFTDFEK